EDNVNRWRGQVGLGPAGPEQLARECKEIDVGGIKGTLVDLVGQKKGSGMPPFAGWRRPPVADSPAGKPTFTVPPGWKEAPLRTFSVATFQVRDGGQAAEITVSPLVGGAGGLLNNVKRWREQVGLPTVSDEQVLAGARAIQVDGQAGHLVDL